MVVYRFDGSFEGFLCAVVDCLEQGHQQPEFVRDGDTAVGGLFDDQIYEVPTMRTIALAFRSRFVG